jgi:hypothetical protein
MREPPPNLRSLWEQEGFALADGYDAETEKYRGLVLPTDGITVTATDATLIVRPERAMRHRASETPVEQAPIQSGPGPGAAPASAVPPDAGSQPPGRTRFFGSKRLQADRYASGLQEACR